jgi:predicted DNA-binding transcriptional regulator YafY
MVTKQQGRDAREPMERLVRLASALHHAGREGVDATRLEEIAGFAGGADPSSQLTREFRHLRAQGWQIDNIAERGMPARYRMTTVDNRLRLKLTPAQQAALRRAALLANRGDLVERLGLPASDKPAEVTAVPAEAHGGALATVVNALRSGSVLRFRYKGTDRVVHPHSVRTQNGTWFLSAREDAGDILKTFVVSRMGDVSTDAPGTAERPSTSRHPGLHPMTWEIDPPLEVTLSAPGSYVADVRRWLGTAQSEQPSGDEVAFVYRVTNRSALRSRLYELGPRVSLLGPDEIRRELLDELAEMAGE